MKMSISLVVALGMGMAVSVFAGEQTPDAVAQASADCFGTRDAGESFKDCIRRVARENQIIEAAAKARQQRTHMTECLSDCENPDCMRACIPSGLAGRSSKNIEPSTRKANPMGEFKSSISGATLDALDNLGSCYDIMLSPGAEDYEGFWICIGTGVMQRFISSSGTKADIAGALPSQARFTLHLILDIAEDMAGTKDRSALSARLGVIQNGPKVEQPTTPQPEEITFATCVSNWIDNRQLCVDQVGTDPKLLTECKKNAGVRFKKCSEKV